MLCWQCFIAFQTNTFDFLVNIEYAKILIQLCWEIVIHETLKFTTTRSNSVPLFMAQSKSEKADLAKETADFSYQKLGIYRRTEN